jgi:hypothetical protein
LHATVDGREKLKRIGAVAVQIRLQFGEDVGVWKEEALDAGGQF